MLCFCHFMIFLDGRRQHGQWQKHQKQCFCLIPSIRIPDWKSLSLLPYLAFTLYILELNFICSASLGSTNFNVWELWLVNNKIPPLPPHFSTFKLRVLQIFAATSQSDGHSSVIFILIIKKIFNLMRESTQTSDQSEEITVHNWPIRAPWLLR